VFEVEVSVHGVGCGVEGFVFRVQGSGFRVQGSGFRVQGSRFAVALFSRITYVYAASQQSGNNVVRFYDFHLKAKVTIWP